MAHLKQTLFGIFTLATIAAGVMLISSPANAGFQFTPAAKAGAPATPAGPDNGPLMPMLAPDKVETDTLNKMPTPPLPALPSDPMASGDAAAQKSAPATQYSSTLPDAIGFGSDLPLVLGLRQIVPPQYAYAFDPGVNQGAKISWNGGKPWDIALNDALKPLGYSASIEGNTVHISSGASAPAQHSAATPVSAPVPPMMTAHAGDIPHAPLSPANDVAAPAAVAPQNAADNAKPVREVYVPRKGGANEVEERVPGKPEDLSTAPKGVVLTPDTRSENKGFWDRVNPENWGKTNDTPAPPVAAETGPVAHMSDNDAKLAAGNVGSSAVASATAQVPNAPDAMPDDTVVPANAPIMLTRGPGEVAKETLPVAAPSGSIIQQTDATPAGEVLNNGTVMKWEAKKGDSLKSVLQQWSDKAKVQLYWVPAQDYKLPKQISMTGNYTDAVADILGAYNDKTSRPVGRLHPNLPNGPSVLIIEPAAS